MVLGSVVVLLILLSMKNTDWDNLDPKLSLSAYVWGVVAGLVNFSAGYSLLASLPWSRWLCLPVAVLSLPAFPIGTALGGYYLWYYFAVEKKHNI